LATLPANRTKSATLTVRSPEGFSRSHLNLSLYLNWRCLLSLKKIEKGVHFAENIFAGFGGIVFLAMMFLGTGDVSGRYLFNNPIRGTMEMSGIMMGAIVLLSWAYTQRNNGHITVDLFISHYSSRTKAVVTFITLFLSLVLFVAITKQSTVIAIRSWQEQRVIPTLGIPTTPFHSFVPIGAALLCIEFIIQMLHLIPEIKKG
jgi:TRAP-type C4-dicarboxylate transport system permease small subunit